MNATSRKAKEIFVAALKLAPDQWDAYLAEACGGDDELRGRVRDLLQANAAAGSFLESPAAVGRVANPSSLSPVATVDEPIREGPGTIIGPYKLLEQIGEGGMGLVFMAEQQQPVRRKVALKILKPGMDTRQVIARFEAERQALALMDHPNIAKVLDAGETGSGRPLLRHGAGQGRADHRLLRPEPPDHPGAAGAVHARLPGRAARPPQGHHSPRHQALERHGDAARRACRW